MSILLICILIFVLFMVAGYAGLALQTRLVDEHKTGETEAVVGQISGLVSLLLALVLGTLIGVSWGYFSAQRTNLENFSAQALRLDQALGRFGPETKPMRDQLKAGIEKAYGAIWGGGNIDPEMLTVGAPLSNAQGVSDFLATLPCGARSIAFAIFLILELGMPYTGLFRVSPAALEQTIEFIDKEPVSAAAGDRSAMRGRRRARA